MTRPNKKCCIVVLGDFGRSPRMQYHTQSLLDEGFHVDIVCYDESQPLDTIRNNANAHFHALRKFPEITLPNLLKYVLKTIWQTINLLITLFTIHRPSFLLVQNPPAVPTFLVCFIYCKVARARFVIDWHNYTYSILALTSNPRGLIVRLSRWIEKFFGRRAHSNFCVTKAMKTDLHKNWGIEAVVLYDRPPVQFQPISTARKHELFVKLSKDYKVFASENDEKSSEIVETSAFTEKSQDGSVRYKKNRPAILISSTSWTPDEDFSILLAALEEYEEISRNSPHYPKLLCIITGKGPQKEYYKNLISKKNWSKISVITPWLEAEDYPLLLASADLGVCLHWSSSGLDLPMKVVDMFGVGLIVCAKNFNCLNELVQHEQTGFVFENSVELAEQITSWFENFPDSAKQQQMKETFHKNLEIFQSLRWTENWELVARPVLGIQ